jgi:hypothetical protein
MAALNPGELLVWPSTFPSSLLPTVTATAPRYWSGAPELALWQLPGEITPDDERRMSVALGRDVDPGGAPENVSDDEDEFFDESDDEDETFDEDDEAMTWLQTHCGLSAEGASKVADVLGPARFCVKELRGLDIEEIQSFAGEQSLWKSTAVASKADPNSNWSALETTLSNLNADSPRDDYIYAANMDDGALDSQTSLQRTWTDKEDGIVTEAFTQTHSMPDCAEKTVTILTDHFKRQEHSRGSSPSLTSQQIFVHIETLEHQLLDEKLDTPEALHWARHVAERIDMALNISTMQVDSEWESEIVMGLTKIRRTMQTLDMNSLTDYITRTDQASQRIAGQDVILLLGSTGSGKSTTILFLAGEELSEMKMGGLPHIGPSDLDSMQPDLRTVITTPNSTSETRVINAVSVGLPGSTFQQPATIMLCDSPGFGDTGGPEIDISNGIGVARAVRLCKSVKLLIVLSRDNLGDRMTGFRTVLAKALTRFIPSLGDRMDTFSYLFTKYPKGRDSEELIHSKLKDFVVHMNSEERSDTSFKALVADMVEKTSKGVMVLDPIKDNPQEFLERLDDSASINDPEAAFCNFATPDSEYRLNKQLSYHERSVRNALGRNDIDMIAFKLQQMQRLNNALELKDCATSYQQCTNDVQIHIESLRAATWQQLDTCIRGGDSPDEEWDICGQNMKQLVGFETVRSTHLAEIIPSIVDACVTKLEQLLDELVSRVQNDLQPERTTLFTAAQQPVPPKEKLESEENDFESEADMFEPEPELLSLQVPPVPPPPPPSLPPLPPSSHG